MNSSIALVFIILSNYFFYSVYGSDATRTSLFNVQLPEIPSFKNHFNVPQSRSVQQNNNQNCMVLPITNPFGLEISLCGRAATFLSDGCIRINRLPYEYSMTICAGGGRQQTQLAPNCIPFHMPMGYTASICPKSS